MHMVAGIDSLIITQDCSDGTREPRLLVGTSTSGWVEGNSDPGEPCKKPSNYACPRRDSCLEQKSRSTMNTVTKVFGNEL